MGTSIRPNESKLFVQLERAVKKWRCAQKEPITPTLSGEAFNPLQKQATDALTTRLGSNGHTPNIYRLAFRHSCYGARSATSQMCNPNWPFSPTCSDLLLGWRRSCEGPSAIEWFVLDKRFVYQCSNGGSIVNARQLYENSGMIFKSAHQRPISLLIDRMTWRIFPKQQLPWGLRMSQAQRPTWMA